MGAWVMLKILDVKDLFRVAIFPAGTGGSEMSFARHFLK